MAQVRSTAGVTVSDVLGYKALYTLLVVLCFYKLVRLLGPRVGRRGLGMRFPHEVGPEVVHIWHDEAPLVEQQVVLKGITLSFSYCELPEVGEGAVVLVEASEPFRQWEGGV